MTHKHLNFYLDMRKDSQNWEHPYADVDAPAFMGPDGTFLTAPQWRDQLLYAPYGKGNMGYYWREIVANVVLKEGLAVLFVSFLLPAIVSTAPGTDAVSRAIFVGLVGGLSIVVMNSWGYNDRVPRHMTVGATVTQFLEGHINWFLALLYLTIGFAFATCGAAVLYTTGSSAIPIIGTPNSQWWVTAGIIQWLFTTVIALTVQDQFTTRKGKPRVFKQRDVDGAADIAPFRPYQEDIGARPLVYGGIVWLLVSVGYLKWGLWSFNSYTYYAGALGLQFLGCGTNAWNNVNCLTSTGTYVAGAGALFILCDVAGWITASVVNAVLFWLHSNEPRQADDDSSYGHSSSSMKSRIENENDGSSTANARNVAEKPKKSARKRVTVSNPAAIQTHLNLDPGAWM